MNYVHRDIAARNCLISEDGKTCKLADFGMAHEMQEQAETGEYYYITENTKDMIPIAWTAPEASTSRRPRVYNEKSDVWSFGVLLWEIFTRGACK